MSDKFWTKSKCEDLSRRLIVLSEKILPNLSQNIFLGFSASPKTLNRWTNNYLGASYGWSSVPRLFGDPDFSQKTAIQDLFLAGHWSNQSSGIAFAANCGHDTAGVILKKKSRKI